MKRLLLVVTMLTAILSLAAADLPAAVWYVDGQIAASGTGGSWEQAKKTIQEAITAAVNGDEVWVKQGTYPLAGTIAINKEVRVYGGFAGVETSRDQRNWAKRPTILDGQNARRCVSVNSPTAKAGLDGFRITRGNNPTGGAIWVGTNLAYTLADATIITNCMIYNNVSVDGGGIYCDNFVGVISNCTIYNNSAYEGGGICLFNAAYPAIANCTIYGNNSDSYGGGIYHYMDSFTYVRNCIVWGNTAAYGSPQVYKYAGSSSYQYCDVQGGYSGTGNKNSDPLFMDAANQNFHLKAGSPCIDAGINTPTQYFGYNVLPATDLDGYPRNIDGNDDKVAKVDMGVYEFSRRANLPWLLLLQD